MRHLTTILATALTLACLALACGAEVTLQGAHAQDGAGGSTTTTTTTTTTTATTSSGGPICDCSPPRLVQLATAPCGQVIADPSLTRDRGLVAWVGPDDPEQVDRLQVPILWASDGGVEVECPVWDTEADLVVEVWGLE